MPSRTFSSLAAAAFGLSAAPSLAGQPADPVFMPGVVSAAASEVRIAFSPDGRQIVWGASGREGGRDQQDVWEMHRTGHGWSQPARASFDTDATEFDPAFSADGRSLYFHSDRAGGFGGADIYRVAVEVETGRFAAPQNLGPGVNSKGDEWAPTPTRRGTLIFASDGWGGLGRHDLFEARLDGHGGRPASLGPAINSPGDDIDPALSPDGRTLVLSSGGDIGGESVFRLYVTERRGTVWTPRRLLGVGCGDVDFGAAFRPGEPGRLYYAAKCAGGPGRADVHVAKLPAGGR
jgi:TolB protein